MTDAEKKAVDEYISNVKSRFSTITELAIFLPSSVPCFWGDDVIARLSDADREKLTGYQTEAQQLRWQISVCDETIQNRLNALIGHVEKIDAGTETPEEAMPLFLMTYGLFDETLRLSALAMKSTFLSDKIARLLERSSDAETNAAARQNMETRLARLEQFVSDGFAAAEKDRAEKHAEIAVKLEANRDAIEDRNRHEGERARITQKQAAEYILRAEKNANITNRSLKLDSIIRRVKAWDAYINSNGKKGTRPAAGYNRYQSPESFAQWARNILASDERYNKSNREH